MQSRFNPPLLAVLAIAPVLSLALGAQAQKIPPGHAADAAQWKAWRESMKQTPVPSKGCFTATYPSPEWRQAACTVAPDVPLLPARGAAHIDTVGNTIDDTAYATSGVLSSAEGYFVTVSGLTSGNAYSLQVNTNTFSTSACSGAANPAACWGWQQFVYESSGSVFMQYWLINYAEKCPSGWNTFTQYGPIYCWKNSSATGVSGEPVSELEYMSLTGKASGGTDTAVVNTGYGNVSAVGADTVLNLEQSWNSAEFNIFGNGNGDQVNFNSGTTLVVQTAINNGTTNAPVCRSLSYTAETNNLSLVGGCCPYGGTTPDIQFMESNASGATATCGTYGLQGNFTAEPYVTNVNVTVSGGPPFYINYSAELEDSTPGATIYYQPTVCGEPEGTQSGYSGQYMDFEVENCSGVSGPIWATAPGYLPSGVGSFYL